MTMDVDVTQAVRGALSAFAAGNPQPWLRLLADDVEFTFPFAPDGRPRVIRGADDVAAYLRGVAAAATDRTIRSLAIHRTDDRDVLVVELTVRGTHTDDAGGRTARDTSSIAVVTMRCGRVLGYRDYWNPQGGRVVSAGAGA